MTVVSPSTALNATLLAILLGFSMSARPVQAQANPGAHQHGMAKLDLVFEAGALTLELDAPLDSLLGFERAPRNAAERAAADAALASLRDAASLIRIDPAARCAAGAVDIRAETLQPQKAAKADTTTGAEIGRAHV